MPVPPLTPLAAAVLHLDRPPERALVLDCADGEPVLLLAREFPTARVRGVDRSEAQVREAIARVGLDPEGRVAFKQGAARALPYPDRFFDLVVAVDARPAPGETHRVLRPGGHLVLVHTHPQGRLQELLSRGLWSRLRRRGIEPITSAAAGDGSFSVGRLGDEEHSVSPI
ncbi:MAG TPA: class I SAM-dependent methyltransferase [Solirubrobacterales bacterium]|nr:class I SAM-dependent methyltransferase [Solirubrobacterales bacterium]